MKRASLTSKNFAIIYAMIGRQIRHIVSFPEMFCCLSEASDQVGVAVGGGGYMHVVMVFVCVCV
jgi:hypothetical protein